MLVAIVWGGSLVNRTNYVPIIRRNYCTYATPGICNSETSGYFKITGAYIIK
jgi:hypothetical protein